ncbi:sulfate permease [Ichthyobacterium seriolicida]|uniref:Sulfate permease n=2 Tax=Ichthyobacterium seriolicida TaxID=242600 RepID=A0A1J1DZ14_9FLAO|nr:sulfate permease [Ichthyobacterium seriolicida]
MGGITAGVVALPLALAFGVQSGMGAEYGIYGAIILGIFASLFGGTDTQISGPTGPMTVVSSSIIVLMSGDGGLSMGVIIATFILSGIFQIILGVLKLGKYVKYMPYPVLSGFMTGIGVIIIIFQIYPFMGHASEGTAIRVFQNISNPISDINWHSVILGLSTIAIIYLFPRITKAVPSALVALIFCTVVSVLLDMSVPIIGEIPSGLPKVMLGEMASVEFSDIILIVQFAVMLSVLGAIDSLLTSVVADNLTKTNHRSNKELIGQGIGNMLSGVVGGIPGAGATMRTVVNINSGGKTRLSGVIHGMLLLAILLGLGKYAAYIPLSVLSGILITVGLGILDYKGLRHILKVPKTSAFILIVVLSVTIFGNLLNAVFIGIVLASVFYMKNTSDMIENKTKACFKLKDINLPERLKGKVFINEIYGSLFFGVASYFKSINVPKEAEILIIRLRKASYIDQSGVYAMEELIKKIEGSGVKVLMSGLDEQPMEMLNKLNIIPDTIPQNRVFKTFEDCKKKLPEI